MSDRDAAGEAQRPADQPGGNDTLLDQLQDAQARFFRDFMDNANPNQNADMVGMYQALMGHLMQDPQQLLQHQARYTQEQFQLWLHWVTQQAQAGRESKPFIEPDGGDRRFAAPEWSAYPVFDYLKQSYLLAARFTSDVVEQSALHPETKRRVSFYTRQFIDAWSPSNFFQRDSRSVATLPSHRARWSTGTSCSSCCSTRRPHRLWPSVRC